jgi:hypothetical protein
MTLRTLLDVLADFVREDLKEMVLPVSQELYTENPPMRAIEVHKQRMPSPEDQKKRAPYILLQIVNGDDRKDESVVNVRMIIVTFEWSAEQGALSLLNIVEKLRFDLQKKGVIGKAFELEKPLEYLIYQEDITPYHVAELSTNWKLPVIEREVNFNF